MNAPLTNARALLQAENVHVVQADSACGDLDRPANVASPEDARRAHFFEQWAALQKRVYRPNLGTSKVQHLDCQDCDECGASTFTRDLHEGICRDCQPTDAEHRLAARELL